MIRDKRKLTAKNRSPKSSDFRATLQVKVIIIPNNKNMQTIQAIKPGPKRTATSTGKPDKRQRDNKNTPGNTPSLKPSKSTTKK